MMIRKFLSRQSLLVLGSIVTIGVMLSSCTKNDDDIVQQPVAGLMVFNLVPDQPAVGVALSGTLLPGSPLAYTSFTGRYLSVYPGSRVIQSYNPASGVSLDSTAYAFEQNKYYSLFVTGANGQYRNIVAVDNFDSLTASSGKAYIRYINAIPDSTVSNVTIATGGSNVVNNNASFGQVSEFVAVTPGQLNVGVSNEGSTTASRTITVDQQKAYTILVMGLRNQTDSAKAVQIRFIENGTITD